MVDFRYHLVSLVSVFLALAVGIILGAGPLQDSIGNTLSGQVESLRESRDQARTEADRLSEQMQAADSELAAAGDQLIGGALTGRTVAFVVLPGASQDEVKEVRAKLEEAGASVTGSIALNDSYSATEASTYRAALARTLAQYAGVSPDDKADSILAASLSHVLRMGRADANASIIVDSMTAADNVLIKVDGDLSAGAEAIVVVGPENLKTPSEKADADKEYAAMTASYSSLMASLASRGATVGMASGIENDNVISILRSAEAGSIVDSLGTTASYYNGVIAVASELSGSHVKLGQSEGATVLGKAVKAAKA